MTHRADSHIHLIENGFDGFFTGRPGVNVDEVKCYDSLAREHDVVATLIIGFEGAPGYVGNNDYLARIKPKYSWIQPMAYVNPLTPPTLSDLERWQQQGFVGLVMYTRPEQDAALPNVPEAIWAWLAERHWLISVVVKGGDWSAWNPILARHRSLRLVIGHMGSPPRTSSPPSPDQASTALSKVIALSKYPGVQVKLSGFYGITEPRHDYPHTAAWPYVQVLADAFGVERLLWGSDYTPCLDWLTFPQTYNLFYKMPFFSKQDCEQIIGLNLLRTLKEVTGS